MTTLTPHIIVRDAARAADWYRDALGAELGSRIETPDGRFMQIELRFGDAKVMIADEFPEMGAVSPLTLGGTYGALTLTVDDVDARWEQAIGAGATELHPLQRAVLQPRQRSGGGDEYPAHTAALHLGHDGLLGGRAEIDALLRGHMERAGARKRLFRRHASPSVDILVF